MTSRCPRFRGRAARIAPFALSILACAKPAPPASAPEPAPPTPAIQPQEDALATTIDELALPYQATVGLAYRIAETGVEYALRGDEAFPMASTYKFPMALSWLRQVDEGRAALDQSFVIAPADLAVYHSPMAEEAPNGGTYALRELVRRLMEQSDNTACDVLLARLGGPAAVNDNLRRLGIDGLRIDRSERQMAVDLLEAARPGSVTSDDRGSLMALDASLTPEERDAYFTAYQSDPRDRTTPLAMVELLARFHEGKALSPESTTLLRDMMLRARSRLGAQLPNQPPVANKTGTGMGSWNDVGIVPLPDGRHLVLAVYVARARGLDWDAGSALVARIARVAYDAALARAPSETTAAP